VAKIEAAKNAGIKKVLIAKENWQDLFEDMDIEVVPVEDIFDVIEQVFGRKHEKVDNIQIDSKSVNVLSASGA